MQKYLKKNRSEINSKYAGNYMVIQSVLALEIEASGMHKFEKNFH